MLTIQPHVPNALRGVLLVMLAVLIFACMDTAGKHLMMRFNVPFVAGARYAVNLLLLLVFLMPRHGRDLWKSQRTGLVVLRGFSLAVSSFFAGLALQQMPVGETIAILYLAPFGVMLLAGPFLGERMGLAGWIAALAGFAGVLLIARPGSGLAPLGVLFAIAGAGTSVVYVLLSRLLASTESTMAMLFHAAIAGLALFGAMLPWHWPGTTIASFDIVLLIFVGVASLTGHYLFTAAYREAPASLLAPVNYFHIAWAILLGWLVFHHVPDGLTFLGIGIIAASGASIAARSHLAKSTPREQS
jgi:drug/metabolite transporter (DMT)-like permease